MDRTESIYGINPVLTLLKQSPSQVLQLYIQAGIHSRRIDEIAGLATKKDIPTEVVERVRLQALAGCDRHQGVFAITKPVETLSFDTLLDHLEKDYRAQQLPPLLVLDQVQDPHNLGACLRTADAVGIAAILIPERKSTPVTAVTRKVACGAAESIPVIPVKNLARSLQALKKLGYWLVGTDERGSMDYTELDWTIPVALVMGNEGSGLRRLTRESCDYLVHIPMLGQVSSLNVSVATGVCLYEMLRQRRHK